MSKSKTVTPARCLTSLTAEAVLFCLVLWTAPALASGCMDPSCTGDSGGPSDSGSGSGSSGQEGQAGTAGSNSAPSGTGSSGAPSTGSTTPKTSVIDQMNAQPSNQAPANPAGQSANDPAPVTHKETTTRSTRPSGGSGTAPIQDFNAAPAADVPVAVPAGTANITAGVNLPPQGAGAAEPVGVEPQTQSNSAALLLAILMILVGLILGMQQAVEKGFRALRRLDQDVADADDAEAMVEAARVRLEKSTAVTKSYEERKKKALERVTTTHDPIEAQSAEVDYNEASTELKLSEQQQERDAAALDDAERYAAP
jgi:hypothetical protein